MKKLLLALLLSTTAAFGSQIVNPGGGSVTVNAGTANGVAIYSGANTIDSTTSIKVNTSSITIGDSSHSVTVSSNVAIAGTLSIGGTAFPYVDWTSYTPTITGAGTVTLSGFKWMRLGNHVWVKGGFRAGTVAATPASITIPTGTIVLQNTDVYTQLGLSLRQNNGGSASIVIGDMCPIFAELAGPHTLVFIGNATASGGISDSNGSSLWNTSDWISIYFDYEL